MLGVVALAGGRREIHEEKELQVAFHSLQFPWKFCVRNVGQILFHFSFTPRAPEREGSLWTNCIWIVAAEVLEKEGKETRFVVWYWIKSIKGREQL